MCRFLCLAVALLLVPTVDAQTPTPAQVLTNFAKAMNEAALLKHSNLVREGTISVSPGEERGTYSIIRNAPNQIANYRETTSQYVAFGTDGHVVWSQKGTVISRPDGEERDNIQRDGGLVGLLRRYALAEYTGTVARVQWEGYDCWRLSAKTAAGKTRSDFYDAQSGLFRGTADTVSVLFLKRDRAYIIDAYAPTDGVQLPIRFRQRSGPVEMKMNVTRSQFDAPLPPNKFPMSPEVRAWLAMHP